MSKLNFDYFLKKIAKSKDPVEFVMNQNDLLAFSFRKVSYMQWKLSKQFNRLFGLDNSKFV